MSTAETISLLRAHCDANSKRERATFSIASIRELLAFVDDCAATIRPLPPSITSPFDKSDMSRDLLGAVIDDVFGGAIEDPSVIEDIYASIKRHEGVALTDAEPVGKVIDGQNGVVFSVFPDAFHKINIGDNLYTTPPTPSQTLSTKPAPPSPPHEANTMVTDEMVEKAAAGYWNKVCSGGTANWPDSVHHGVQDIFREGCRAALEASLSTDVMHALGVEGLVDACKLMADDYQTSDTHHPDHILVPRAAFESMCAALSASSASKEGESL